MRNPSDRHADERELVRACIEGDPDARRRLVRLYHRAVRQTIEFLSVARSGRVQSADVDDAVQQVFVTIFDEDALVLRRWAARARLGTYLCRVAERVAVRHFQRALTVRGRFLLSLDAPDPGGEPRIERIIEEAQAGEDVETLDARLIRAEEVARVRRAVLARLTPKGRQFYDYLFVQELDVATIAHLEGTTPNNVYQWKNRIAKTALEVLGTWVDDG